MVVRFFCAILCRGEACPRPQSIAMYCQSQWVVNRNGLLIAMDCKSQFRARASLAPTADFAIRTTNH